MMSCESVIHAVTTNGWISLRTYEAISFMAASLLGPIRTTFPERYISSDITGLNRRRIRACDILGLYC